MLAVPFWSLIIPWYFQSRLFGYLGPFMLAAIVSYRIFFKRGVKDDKLAFRIWNLWIVSIYTILFHVRSQAWT